MFHAGLREGETGAIGTWRGKGGYISLAAQAVMMCMEGTTCGKNMEECEGYTEGCLLAACRISKAVVLAENGEPVGHNEYRRMWCKLTSAKAVSGGGAWCRRAKHARSRVCVLQRAGKCKCCADLGSVHPPWLGSGARTSVVAGTVPDSHVLTAPVVVTEEGGPAGSAQRLPDKHGEAEGEAASPLPGCGEFVCVVCRLVCGRGRGGG